MAVCVPLNYHKLRQRGRWEFTVARWHYNMVRIQKKTSKDILDL